MKRRHVWGGCSVATMIMPDNIRPKPLPSNHRKYHIPPWLVIAPHAKFLYILRTIHNSTIRNSSALEEVNVGYYLAYQQMNNQEYTYKLYGYDEATDTYPVIFKSLKIFDSLDSFQKFSSEIRQPTEAEGKNPQR